MLFSKDVFNLFHWIIPPIIAIDSAFIPKGSTSRVKETGLKNKRLIQIRKEPVINKKLIFNQVSVTKKEKSSNMKSYNIVKTAELLPHYREMYCSSTNVA